MTVIAAVRDPARRKTLIGWDSRCVSGANTILPSACRKFLVRGNAAVGISGYFMAMMLVHRVRGLFKGAAVDVCIRIRDTLHEQPWDGEDGKGPWGAGCSFVLVMGKDIYDVGSDFCPTLVDDGTLWARGSGSDYAIGAGHALSKAKPRERLHAAIEAACAFDTGCGPPVNIQEIPW